MCATENPIEFEGTYPLPEAQLDRFLFKLLVGYPTRRRSARSCAATSAGFRARDLDQIDLPALLDPVGVLALQSEAMAVRWSDDVLGYAAELGAWLREPAGRAWRTKPPWAIALVLAAKVMAAARATATSRRTTCSPSRCRCCATGSCCRPMPSCRAVGRRRGRSALEAVAAPR